MTALKIMAGITAMLIVIALLGALVVTLKPGVVGEACITARSTAANQLDQEILSARLICNFGQWYSAAQQ